MTSPKDQIKITLQRFGDGNLAENARNLLNVLGYDSQRSMSLEPNTADGFLSALDPDDQKKFKPERALTEEWESIDLLFQLMDEDIGDNDYVEIPFERGEIDNTRMESYLFFSLKLRENHYTRTQLSQITREINKPFPMPAMILFQHGDTLTLSVIDRRLHKLDESKDVLEKTTLIKDINFADPHRAHIDILFDLSIAALYERHKFKNFPQLHEAWKKTLDTEALNRHFYLRLFSWFKWAVSEARFPENEKRNLKTEQHIIRLITRLLFVWFIKEKGLVADELFDEREVALFLKDYNRDTGDSYYRAVLQNLFFATLNTEIDERRFSKGKSDHRNFSVYRYRDQMNNPDSLEALLGKTPFINGGLFDCLDDFKGIRAGGSRIDCFSDEHYRKLSLPNRLFFGDDGLISVLTHYKFTVEESTPIEKEVALDPELLGKVFENLLATYNPETGETKRKQTGSFYTPRPIVDYMVEEALIETLVEQVSPTDSDAKFWDERLHYLFDYAQVYDDASEWFDDNEIEALVRAISELKILDPAVGSGAFPMGMLHKLTLALRRLDPDNIRWEQLQRDRAGHRAQAAFKISNQQTRDDELKEISDTFERYRDSDFGRKLYLIQNSIFGVDIQPEACQIAKLRFFISLAIEQVVDETVANFGIKPLPNLETRFVAANTLIGLQLAETRLLLQQDTVQELIKEIEGIREKYYLTNNRGQKLHLEELEDDCRERLKEELESQKTKWIERQKREIERKVAQLPNPEHREQLREVEQKEYKVRKKKFDFSFEDARKIASWKPYDQNKEADWFDPEWMFGIADGFDVVIGNPPYVRQEKIKALKPTLKTQYDCYTGTADLYVYFYERGFQLLRDNGILTYISSNKYFRAAYGVKLRNFLSRQSTVSQLIDFGDAPVFTSIAYPSIITACKSHDEDNILRALNWQPGPSIDEFGTVFQKQGFTMPQNALTDDGWRLTSPTVLNLLKKLRNTGKPLREYVKGRFYRGVLTGLNEAFVVDQATRNQLIEEHPSSVEVLKPFLRGRDVKRWGVNFAEQYLVKIESSENRTHPWSEQSAVEAEAIFADAYPAIHAHLQTFRDRLIKRYDQGKYFWELRACAYWEEFQESTIVWGNLAKNPKFAFSRPGVYLSAPATMMVSDSAYILGLMNSRITKYLVSQSAAERQGGFLEFKPMYISPIAIPNRPQDEGISNRVRQILDAKHANPEADVSELENEIDQIVYSLYNLTPDEIAIVEENAV